MTEEDFAEAEDDLPTGLPSDQEWLEDLEEHLKDFLDQVERAKQRADEDPINRHQFGRVKRVLESHDEQLDRQEFIHSVGNAARTEIPPFDKEDRVGNSDRRRKMMHLQNTVFQMWDNATAAYIDGQFYGAAVTMTSAFEGYLKHEIEKRDLDDNPRNLSLKDAISTARGEIIPHAGAEASDAADRILKIRNNRVRIYLGA
jgi:hypothetical protein